jgi:carbonic anhydrase
MKIHQPMELIEDVNEALQILKDGNERYIKGEFIHRDGYNTDRAVLSNGQKPFAVILTCSDSRVAPEIFFDQKLGSIFVIRNAGNIVDMTVLGSLEYAVDFLKSRLVVVCGHSKCGAVMAACSDEEFPPNIKHIVKHIRPAVKKGGDIDKIIRNNVEVMVEQIKANDTVKKMGVLVIGAYYDIHSGLVEWL